MALSGNGRMLYEIRGRNDTRLRLTLATDPATAKLRVGLASTASIRIPEQRRSSAPAGMPS